MLSVNGKDYSILKLLGRGKGGYSYPVSYTHLDVYKRQAHKINNVLGQALLAKKMGKTRLIAETGAGQHGVCLLYTSKNFIKKEI